MIENVTFARPEAAYLLGIAVLFLGLFLHLFLYRRHMLQQFASSALLTKLLVPRSKRYYAAVVIATVGAWIFSTLALMQPRGQIHEEQVKGDENTIKKNIEQDEKNEVWIERRRKAHDVIFLLDVSASMTVKDTRTGVTRLDYAKEIIDEVIRLLDGQTVVLYAFTSHLITVVPPTMDYLFTRMMLKRIPVNEGGFAGTDLIEVLESLRQRYFNSTSQHKTIIVLSDGGDTLLESLTEEKRKQDLQAILSRLDEIEKYPMNIFTIGVGSLEGGIIPGVSFEGKPVKSKLTEDILIKLSEKGKGRYYFADTYSSFAIAQDIALKIKQDTSIENKKTLKAQTSLLEQNQINNITYRHYFQFPLGIAIILLAATLLLPEVKRKDAA